MHQVCGRGVPRILPTLLEVCTIRACVCVGRCALVSLCVLVSMCCDRYCGVKEITGIFFLFHCMRKLP